MRGVLSLYILLALGFYLVFPKYGEDGWKALVPVYRLGVHARHVGLSRPFFALCIVGALVLAMHVAGYVAMIGLADSLDSGTRTVALMLGNIAVYMTMALLLLVGPAFMGVLSARTARRFGKSLWFAVGLCLLWPAFMIVLGVDKSATYISISKARPSRGERLVDLAFCVLGVLSAFVLFAIWIKLSFTLPNQ